MGTDFDPEGEREREVARIAAEDHDHFFDVVPQFYRGELSQLTKESRRIDQSTDWAVAVMAAIIALAFARPESPSYLLFVGMAAMCVFLAFETRRYRTYDVWRSRVRVLQENVFANTFDPSGVELADWRTELGDDLRRPTFKITLFAPERAAVEAAALPALDGRYVIGAVAAFYLGIALLAYWPTDRQAKGEFYGEEVGDWKLRK